MKALLLIPLLLSSCVVANGNMVASMGGKIAYKGKDFGLVSDHTDSFRDAAVLAGLAVGAWQTVAATKATEATNQVVNRNATKLGIANSNNAKDIAVEGIKSDTIKATTLPK